MIRHLILATALLCGGFASSQALEPGAPFADHAVLQREMPVPVWGWSEPGARVTVSFGGQSASATAADNGKWTVTLDPLEASAEPRVMTISEEGGESLTLENLLVGEVWMASGQSNMQWVAGKSSVRELVAELQEKGLTPPIREFEVTSVYAAHHPIEKASGEWKTDDFSNYSAIAFAFAHKLHQELDVPIGILNCSFSQTSIEAWVPREGFAGGSDDYTRSIHQKLLETDPSTPEHKAAWDAFYESIEQTLRENAELVAAGKPARPVSTATPGNMNGNRDATWMFNGRMSPVVPYAIRGAIWNQGYANMNAGLQYYHNLHSLIRGWRLKWDNPELPVYFHQFYCPGNLAESTDFTPSIGSTAEMRLGTWLARDIPHTGMASQIDIDGAIHYGEKRIPGERLALHALKNQYGQSDLVADGPMFRSCSVEGDRMIVEFDHAEGGLVIATQGVPSADAVVSHFYLAGDDRVWHPACVVIDGSRAIVSSPAVKNPRGISYGTGGIGPRPALYNQALLPATPFIRYDNQTVTSETWPGQLLEIAGVEPDPASVGRVYEFRKMPLLSTQFRDHAILQADVPVTIFGSAVLYPGHPPHYEEEAEIRFSFVGVEETIPVTRDMREWSITLPPMSADDKTHTLRVSFHIGDELVHQRVVENIRFGDVWYVASPGQLKLPSLEIDDSGQVVQVMTRKAKRSSSPRPSRFTVSTSTDPETRFSSSWEEAGDDLAAAIGHRLAAKSGRPTGIIHMTSGDVPLNSWIPFHNLAGAASLRADYENLAQVAPGNEFYDANARRYIADWKSYWQDYIPQMIATRAVPDSVPWGSYPQLAGEVTSEASQTHNVLAASFVPGSFKGVIFIAGPAMVEHDGGLNFGPELSVLANGFIEDFGGQARFIHSMPDQTLAPGVTAPKDIPGASQAVTISDWSDLTPVLESIAR